MFKKNLILVLVVVSALTISGAAAYFSVYGLSKLFAGAGISVVIMASVLEASKLITAFALHDRRDDLPKLVRVYLSIAVAVLMIITSAGIYGFLSNAYQVTATANTIVEKEVGIINARVDNLNTRLSDAQSERESIVNDINQLRQGLSSGTQISYIDKESGERITTTSSATRKSLENQLEDAVARRDIVSSKIEDLSTQIDSLKIGILEKQSNNEAAAELGPLIYLSKITGLEMDTVINYFILMIIFVFDPLAITLVISISYLSNSSKNKVKNFAIGVDNSILNEVFKTDKNSKEEEIINTFNDIQKTKPKTLKRKPRVINTKKDTIKTAPTKKVAEKNQTTDEKKKK